MTYLVSPTDPSTPTDDQGATQGAEELRALKGYLSGLLGFPNGFNTFRKNTIINGDFNIWQRGSPFVAIADSTYCADRWLYLKSGAVVHDISISADVPTVAQAGRLFVSSILIDCQTVDAAIAAGDYARLAQRIEGYNWQPLAQRACVLSFWVKATKTGIYCVSFRNTASDRSYVAEYTVNVTDTWEYKTISLPASPSAGTWDYGTGIGLVVEWSLSCGATFQAAAGAWLAGYFAGTVNQVNATDNVANNFRLCGVQLEASVTATPFEGLSIPDSLMLCQRYYQVPNISHALGPTGANVQFSGCWPTQMRVAPTITGSGAAPTLSAQGYVTSVPSAGTSLITTASAEL